MRHMSPQLEDGIQGDRATCCRSGVPVSIYVCPDGSVVIADLFEWLIPIAYSLDPGNLQIATVISNMKKGGKD